ncbi:MAG: 4,5-DOPA dioxygenase extradiol [Neisseriales bacterium]|nr:MAG: 4,5-DOPA dioxygenase extradiol [Neisseriales bacterium]
MSKLMPVLFIGHGSPMNALENNQFTSKWREVASSFDAPKAILAISAHWYINELALSSSKQNQTIHDFYGFPVSLHKFNYPALGNPELASHIKEILAVTGELPEVFLNHEWGLDHGVWSILCHMYPEANIPVIQLSIMRDKTASWHYELARKLCKLREEGVLILASGNIVHNLRLLDWHNVRNIYPWAKKFDESISDMLIKKNHAAIINYEKLTDVRLAVPSEDHFIPLLYAIGAANESDEVTLFNQAVIYGSLSMTSVIFTS